MDKFTYPSEKAGQQANTKLDGQFSAAVQSYNYKLNAGLVLYPLDFATYTVTDGSDGDDTFWPTVTLADGTVIRLTEAPVPWGTSDDATADAHVAAINDWAANHKFYAVKTDTDDYTVFCRRYDPYGQAMVFSMEVEEDADGTLVDFDDAGAPDPIPVVSGETDNLPDTYDYYELGIDTTGAYDLDGTPRAGEIDITSDESEPWMWWCGFFNPDAATPANGVDVAGEATETLPLPFKANPALTGYIVSGLGDDVTVKYVIWAI